MRLKDVILKNVRRLEDTLETLTPDECGQANKILVIFNSADKLLEITDEDSHVVEAVGIWVESTEPEIRSFEALSALNKQRPQGKVV